MSQSPEIMTEPKRAALYLRVSTDDQTCETQRRELLIAAQRHGWAIAAEYRDDGISGAKGRDRRPAFDALLKGAVRRDFDLIAAWSVDRLSRSVADLVAFLGELHASGIGLYLHQQGIDTTTPAGKAMFQMMGVFAEFERAMIAERVKAGVARKRSEQGGRWGRGRVSAELETAILQELRNGTGVQRTSRLLGCGVSTVQRVRDEAGV